MCKQGLVYFSLAVLLGALSAQSAFAQSAGAARGPVAATRAAGGGEGRTDGDAITAFKNACCGDGVTGAVPGRCDADLVQKAMEQLTGAGGSAAPVVPGR